uniref:G-protein coupled receptors family 1 profile domain-containing protein n=1 Tax=Vespula pensylvanica TaxID=30213 RepID=A0A834KQG6_VESPE|nr:hypothetical protein H0235_013525 [Vespula pensylvanica]
MQRAHLPEILRVPDLVKPSWLHDVDVSMTFVSSLYMAIVNPLRPRMGRRATLCVAVVIWIVGAILSFPMLLFYTTYTQNFVNGEVRVICYSVWPDIDDNGLSFQEYLYNVIFMILTYFLPIGSMTFTYARVGAELWGSQSIGEATARQLENIRSKRRSETIKFNFLVKIKLRCPYEKSKKTIAKQSMSRLKGLYRSMAN